jgi:serine-type D-Ala-D-Ala carboxypeptidase (penicillin-binding protein 5/6)
VKRGIAPAARSSDTRARCARTGRDPLNLGTVRRRAAAAIAAACWLVAASTSAARAQTVSVPPAAPPPTSSGSSPDAPDPNPPPGGIGPDGRQVGGPLLQSRGLVLPAGVPTPPATVDAAAWTLVDLDTGNVIAGRDVHGRYQPASILKLLTAVTILPSLPGDQVVTVSASAAHTECACAGLVTGGQYSIDNLMSGLLLVSGNDAAIALAQAYGGVEKTVAAMNAEVLSLGAYDTFAQTPSGLDGWQQLTSAYDMALILRAAMNNPRLVAYDEERAATLPAQNANGVALDAETLTNQTNNFLDQIPGALAAKIGYTDAAQHTYVAAAERDGRRLGVVLLRAQKYPVDQWQQAAQLLDWGYTLPASTQPVGHLDAPLVPVTPSSKPGIPSPGAAGHVDASTRSGASSPDIGWGIAAGLALAAVLTTFELTRRRRRPATVNDPATAVDS